MSSVNMKAPGRLGDPTMKPQDDPRLHPNLRAGFAHAPPPEAPEITAPVDSPLSEIKPFIDWLETVSQGMYDNIPIALPGDENAKVDESTETIKGIDGNDIKLYISKPIGTTGPLPGVLYIHGGGMTTINTYNQVHNAWRKDLALQGLVVITVDFRNAHQPDGTHHPFPAGLNDCSSAVDWIHSHLSQLGISKLVVQGESGGGNLTLATTLKAKKEGRIDHIDGVYATVPFISGDWHQSEEWKLQHYPSMVENDTYVLEMTMMGLASVWYDPERKEKNNCLAWPSKATAEDLKGLPPHVITVSELDPLRDEGWEYFRKLQDAGVSVVGRMNLGLVHGAELIFRQGVYQARMDQIRDIKSFAYSL
jgi:acetyl esterase